jgi:molecular chaperone IbpA
MKGENKMTNLSIRSIDIPSIHKFAVGFDTMLDELMRSTTQPTNYPPYNIVKYTEDKFAIELAIAGFVENDIDVTVEKNQLTVKGEKSTPENPHQYVHRGISSRSFVRTWTLADHVEVSGAKMQDGILVIHLVRIVPEEQKPKRIQIEYIK